MDELIRFLGLDAARQDDAKQIWALIEPHACRVIKSFYEDVQRSDVGIAISDLTIDHLKKRQTEHWRSLFQGEFDQRYFNNASLIGIKHYEIGLDPKWYIAGYTKVKSEFTTALLETDLDLQTKERLVRTLNGYFALDMALGISSYTAILID